MSPLVQNYLFHISNAIVYQNEHSQGFHSPAPQNKAIILILSEEYVMDLLYWKIYMGLMRLLMYSASVI